MTDINKTLIVNDEDIIEMSFDVLRGIYAKWKNVFNQSIVNVNDFNSVIEDDRVQIFFADAQPIAINVSATKTSLFYEDLNYEILAWVREPLVKLFDTDALSIYDLRERFYLMAQELGGFECENKTRASSEFSFDKFGNLTKVRVIFQNHKDPTLSDENYQHLSDHYIYDIDDIVFLKENGLNELYQPYLRDFYFLWEHTHIEDILIAADFLASFKLYAEDITRYNSLIAMTKI
jgi:hypothetical protein